MCLSLTPTGSRHAVTVTVCPKMPDGQQYFLLPLPGAPPFRCPHPCGGRCPFMVAATPPPPLPDEIRLHLRLAPTLVELVAGALAVTEPAGTAADLTGPMSWGSQRYYRN